MVKPFVANEQTRVRFPPDAPFLREPLWINLQIQTNPLQQSYQKPNHRERLHNKLNSTYVVTKLKAYQIKFIKLVAVEDNG